MIVFGLEISMAVIWLALAVIFLIIEALTVGLTTIWFAAGAIVALVLSLFKLPLPLQITAFLVVSLCLLLFTRKIFVEKLKTGAESTNVSALIGQVGEVIGKVGSLDVGQVRIKGQVWSAISKSGTAIDRGRLVKVISIEGVKLIVEPIDEK